MKGNKLMIAIDNSVNKSSCQATNLFFIGRIVNSWEENHTIKFDNYIHINIHKSHCVPNLYSRKSFKNARNEVQQIIYYFLNISWQKYTDTHLD